MGHQYSILYTLMGHQYIVVDVVSYFPRYPRSGRVHLGPSRDGGSQGAVHGNIEFKQSVKKYLYFLPFLFLILADTYDHE